MHVSLSYRSDDGHQSISISQMAAADHSYEHMINDENWHEVTPAMGRRSGSDQPNGVKPRHTSNATERSYPVSDNLTGDQLATIAAGLRPAPSTGDI